MRIYKCNKNQRERRDSDLIGNMDTLKCVTAGGMAAEGWYRVYEATVAVSSISGFGSGGDNGIIFISTNYNYSSPMSCILLYTVEYGGIIHWNCISCSSNNDVRIIDKIRFSLIPGSKVSIDIHYRTSNNNNFEIKLISNRFGKKFHRLENAQPITDNPLTISEYDIPVTSDLDVERTVFIEGGIWYKTNKFVLISLNKTITKDTGGWNTLSSAIPTAKEQCFAPYLSADLGVQGNLMVINNSLQIDIPSAAIGKTFTVRGQIMYRLA